MSPTKPLCRLVDDDDDDDEDAAADVCMSVHECALLRDIGATEVNRKAARGIGGWVSSGGGDDRDRGGRG